MSFTEKLQNFFTPRIEVNVAVPEAQVVAFPAESPDDELNTILTSIAATQSLKKSDAREAIVERLQSQLLEWYESNS